MESAVLLYTLRYIHERRKYNYVSVFYNKYYIIILVKTRENIMVSRYKISPF